MRKIIFNVIILLNIIIYHVFGCTDEPIVNTKNGKIKGKKLTEPEGREYCGFKGIPFAKPPVGDLRFKDPEPAESWMGVREATAYGSNCAQHNWFINKIYGDEDCLFLNVFTKNTEAKRPVMVWIHGGCFLAGNGDDELFGPDYLMRKDIVLVTINYRLGIFGFMSMSDDVVTGNQGMKDQVMALQWVQDNIANFGGDPNSVTVFGESAGGAALHYLTLSPLTKGLFHRVIVQSGVAINPWTYQINSENQILQLSNKLGHKETNPKSVVEFLKTIEAKQLLKVRKDLISKEEKLSSDFGFLPCIDAKSKNPFMPVHPEIAAEKGIHMPVMIGHTNREGILFTKRVQELRNNLSKDYTKLFHRNFMNVLEKYGLTYESLKRVYFKDELVTQQNSEHMIDLLGDVNIVEGTHRVIKIQIQKGLPAPYYYQFTYDKITSPFKIFFGSKLTGASHADELFYLFKHEFFVGRVKFPEKGSERYRIMEQMVEMWVNFASTGTPTTSPSELLPFEWTPVNNDTMYSYLNICEDSKMAIQPSIELKYRSSI